MISLLAFGSLVDGVESRMESNQHKLAKHKRIYDDSSEITSSSSANLVFCWLSQMVSSSRFHSLRCTNELTNPSDKFHKPYCFGVSLSKNLHISWSLHSNSHEMERKIHERYSYGGDAEIEFPLFSRNEMMFHWPIFNWSRQIHMTWWVALRCSTLQACVWFGLCN